jgi:hypothetical protein
VTVNRTILDDWGVRVTNGVTENYKSYVSYKMETRGNEVNTNRPSLELVPVGNVFFTGLVIISYDDEFNWTGHDGKELQAKARTVDYIMDASGKVILTKVSF